MSPEHRLQERSRAWPWRPVGVAIVLLVASHLTSRALLADHVVASLLSPGGLTLWNLALALGWISLRLMSVFGAPALLAWAAVRAIPHGPAKADRQAGARARR